MHVNRADSLVNGGSRVRNMHPFREKWRESTRPKSLSSSSSASRKNSSQSATGSSVQGPHSLSDASAASTTSASGSRLSLSAMDMERYLMLSSWLSQNGISVSPPHEPRRSSAAQCGAMNPFDDVYSALEALEKAVEGDIAQLDATRPIELTTAVSEVPRTAYRQFRRVFIELFTL